MKEIDKHSASTLLGDTLLSAIKQAVREEIRAANDGAQDGKKGADTFKPYLTIKEAADISRLGTSTIRLLIRKRELRAQRVGRRVIIKRTDLEKFLEANPIEAI